ncbi:hypothetical protein [Halocola ammonii]
MSAVITTLAIISIFSGHAKEHGQSRWKWALLGLASFWIPGFGLSFLLVQIVGDNGETWQITTITIGTFLIFGCKWLSMLKGPQEAQAKSQARRMTFQ